MKNIFKNISKTKKAPNGSRLLNVSIWAMGYKYALGLFRTFMIEASSLSLNKY